MNEIQQIQVSTKGAELTSLVANGREYLWQGDSQFWGCRAPILFPIVGRLSNDTLLIDGTEHKMKQHGFARDTEFVPLQMSATFDWLNGIRIIPNSDPIIMQMMHEQHENFPYEFNLKVRYALYENALEVNWEVQNSDDKTMFFQIGAHPGFMLPDYCVDSAVHGFLRCYDNQGHIMKPVSFSHLIDGLRVPNAPREVENKKGLIPITNNTFAEDALLLDSGNIASVGLIDINGKEIIRVSSPQAQVFGLWAPNKSGCPFVCIEPWCGVADKQGFHDDISKRDCIQSLASGKIYSFDYTIEILG